jgi:hypothetical protein
MQASTQSSNFWCPSSRIESAFIIIYINPVSLDVRQQPWEDLANVCPSFFTTSEALAAVKTIFKFEHRFKKLRV